MAVNGWRLPALMVLTLAAGCGNDPGGSLAELKSLKGAAAPQEAAAPPAAKPPAGTLLHMTLEDDGRTALMARVTERGTTQTYLTTDPISFTLKGGRLVETRGLSFDLISAEPGPPLAALRGGESYLRRWQVTGAEDAIRDIRLHCSARVTTAGAERRVDERCDGEGFSVVNQFVMISPQTLAWSRQWIGPRAGHAVLLRPEH
ncbi:YjbF family lipoprotein [Falsigemmobacter faecalis]|uniref:YjbF family lipoprotein n=1 Tax=Falsigemmobacter faecalis TaxID=2488730 RepID=A0A3P3DQL8_9RHOB|nr:YjbF family lipoprotein [Falsigemmobacter faecalis]RRH76563.1 hypothetical protein EG244_05165 [Falsigemmobacter faecalis]